MNKFSHVGGSQGFHCDKRECGMREGKEETYNVRLELEIPVGAHISYVH